MSGFTKKGVHLPGIFNKEFQKNLEKGHDL